MTMTTTIQNFLAKNGIAYDIVPHNTTSTTLSSAQSAHIRGDMVAKSVILEDEIGYLMAVVPATHRVKIGKLNRLLDRHMGLATEEELKEVFFDCAVGAIPPIGPAYGMQSIVDDDLLKCDDIYFEAGNHHELIHIKGKDFQQLMKGAPHSSICLH